MAGADNVCRTLATNAGPWIRVDDTPFGGGITELLGDGKVVLPATLDESGNPLTVGTLVLTGTHSDGTWSGSSHDCSNWSSSSGGAYVGRFGSGAGAWSSEGSATCGSGRRLLCFDPGNGAALPPYSSWGRLAFLSSATGPGNFGQWAASGGVDAIFGGDEVCKSLASATGFSNPAFFKARLSNSNTDASSQFTNDGPWMRVDGVRIANGIADLVDGNLAAPLDVTETGDHVGVGSFTSDDAWTGTLDDGTRATNNCSQWKSNSAGVNGDAGATDTAIFNCTEYGDRTCNTSMRVYCRSDSPLIFGDGFEGASAANWSASNP